MSEVVLTINAGSSSLKFALFERQGQDLVPRLRGQIEGIPDQPHLSAHDADGAVLAERRWAGGILHEDLLGGLLTWIEDHLDGESLVAAGHRVVHGGVDFAAPIRVDSRVLAKLDALCPLAPLHQPHNLAAIRVLAQVRPGLPQIACFDTGFHATQPSVATRFALPPDITDAGVRRYGFHGLSYEYIAGELTRRAPALACGRVIAAHLGNGASLCALRDGRSIDTTMGFTALDGLMMGTRCGTIDPGVLLYLMQDRDMDARQIEEILYHRSGLLGVSGESADMRKLLASSSPAAAAAVELFVYRVAREAGALASSLGGLDGLVFTAGIGEHAAPIRAAICQRLSWLGVRLDEAANESGRTIVSMMDSAVSVWVIPTDEETMIARHAAGLIPRERDGLRSDRRINAPARPAIHPS